MRYLLLTLALLPMLADAEEVPLTIDCMQVPEEFEELLRPLDCVHVVEDFFPDCVDGACSHTLAVFNVCPLGVQIHYNVNHGNAAYFGPPFRSVKVLNPDERFPVVVNGLPPETCARIMYCATWEAPELRSKEYGDAGCE